MNQIYDVDIISLAIFGYGIRIRFIKWNECMDESIKNFSINKSWNKYRNTSIYIYMNGVDVGFILKLNRE